MAGAAWLLQAIVTGLSSSIGFAKPTMPSRTDVLGRVSAYRPRQSWSMEV
jgi:hypothetical protein